MSAIRVGAVTEAKGHRYHAIVEGQAPCGSGHGKILVRNEQYVGVELNKLTARSTCRHAACRKAIAAQLDAAQAECDFRSSGPVRQRIENDLIRLVEIFESPTDTARRADVLARVRAARAAHAAQRVETHPPYGWLPAAQLAA